MDGGIQVIPVQSSRHLKQFITLPWVIYRDDPLWVPPLLYDLRQTLSPCGNPLFRASPKHRLFLAYKHGVPAGRICAGINDKANKLRGTNQGYICMFECTHDYSVARALFDSALDYLVELGADSVQGPISPTNGDESRGVLIQGYDTPPVLFQAYNPSYYREFFERYGFVKDFDYLAYRSTLESVRDRTKAVAYAMKRYGFRTDPLDLSRLEKELADIKQILDKSIPEDWPDLVPPEMEDLLEMGKKLRGLAVPDLVRIARKDALPIGVSAALPDYNQVLKMMNGRLFPTGWLTFYRMKNRIDGVCMFILFVIPEFQKKGVAYALYHDTLEAARRLGYAWGEGSTVADFNQTMRREAASFGGVHYKTFRVYRKSLTS
ncbi:MAG: GNAT family N-acetyltransferase [Bacillota bacterium]